MKTFHKSIQSELLKYFGGSTVILFTIVMTIMLIRILGLASKGRADPADVILLIGLNSIGNAAPILALSLFITVVSTFSRMYLDSEMVIWFSSGISVTRFIKPLFNFSWPIFLVIGLLLLFAWPWSNYQTQYLKERFEKRGDIERVAPGQFQQSISSGSVFFIEKNENQNELARSVFISKIEGPIETLTTAKNGEVETLNEDRFLSLKQGQQTVINHQSGEVRVIEFENFKYLIDFGGRQFNFDSQSQMKSTLELFQDNNKSNLGELFWRFGLLIAAIVLTFLALQLASVNPRAGRSYSIGVALLCFIGYYNFITVGKRLIADGTFTFAGMMLTIHGTAIALVLILYLHAEFNLNWRRFFSMSHAKLSK
jgi:lipopolysaccharide export system permease protein